MQEFENSMLGRICRQMDDALGNEMDEITVERAVLGLFFTGVKLSTGHGGLCFTPVKEMPEAVCCPSSAKAMPLSGQLKGRPVREYLQYVFSGNILKRALGIAAMNALSTYILEREDRKDLEITYGADAFDELDPDIYPKTVVVGALVPMMRKLLSAEADFTVLEQDPRTLKPRELEHYLPAEKASECVPDADLLVITGVTILNDTLPGLLEMAKPGAHILVTGPTASMMPDVFFDSGVTMIGGIQVTRADELLDLISEGGSGYHFFGRYAERTVIKKVIPN